ncbi:uncharacterized protein LOC131635901 isoform X2 [Vicia villosa]|uniref:uncharacterized protein LOC131635901 isoform X2 n=1 Tax=Vicia villosa TaxID=3911 RepID=UPI00273AD9E4|nr:uncharacterized protein LOC131635901 isoform X2 [Vicia villosa]
MKPIELPKKNMSFDPENMIPQPNFGSFPVDVYQYLSKTATGQSHSLDDRRATVDMQRLKKSEGPMESSSKRKGKEKVFQTSSSSGTDLSNGKKGSDKVNIDKQTKDIWDDLEVREVDLGPVGKRIVWRRKIKSSRVARRNVLVVQEHLMVGHESIVLYDSDRRKSYNCVLHRADQKTLTERYICKEWYTFVRNRKIKVGDRIGFSLRPPDCDQLLVTVKRKKSPS